MELLYPNGNLATLFELNGAGKILFRLEAQIVTEPPAPLVIENTVKSAVTPEGGTTSQMAAAVNPPHPNSAPSTYKWLLGLAASGPRFYFRCLLCFLFSANQERERPTSQRL